MNSSSILMSFGSLLGTFEEMVLYYPSEKHLLQISAVGQLLSALKV
jgi:hypothetical protein